MKPALVLVDFQEDFLHAAGLEPAAGKVVDSAANLLRSCRERRIPVIHVWTTVQREPDSRMPHWREKEIWRCVEGTPGHKTPPSLTPIAGETLIHKRFFSGFGSEELDRRLRANGCDAIVLAGVHLHGCVRATAFDAYQRGYRVLIAEDAVASDDPIHAAITRCYLERRAARFLSVDRVLERIGGEGREDSRFSHFSPVDRTRELWSIGIDGAAAVRGKASAARCAWRQWRLEEPTKRGALLRRWASKLLGESRPLADLIVRDIGKPIAQARGEIRRSAELLELAAAMAEQPLGSTTSAETRFRYEPLGVVGIITPYNNPVGIPAGKIAPALAFGNTVVWKPAPAATAISHRVLEIAREAGIPDGVLGLCAGDHSTALRLAEDDAIDGVTLSGSALAGYAIQEICARRRVPYQGELGGNNASIVWEDAELTAAAEKIAEGAFGFAGQRCTANRRVIVAESCFEAFISALKKATAQLVWGDPSKPETVIGPLISARKRSETEHLLRRAREDGLVALTPHREQADFSQLMDQGSFFPPTIVFADRESHEIVQEESFAPILVVQRATDFNHSLALCNGVRQGLVAAVFSSSPRLKEQFLLEARAGVLKINRATADADAASPLGGWKASGVGPAEHGPSDREFYCRVQTIYG
ncbi:MAG: aldehyde dehydrogenase family protein [Phycisphaeraceae bacterium]|nr:aldehyde dehydrogenase family protein [Phycisphaeraceae bacterium]